MPGPLDYLRKIGFKLPPPEQSAPLAPGEDMPGSAPMWFDKPIEAALGAIGVGRDTSANRFGQVLGAAVPFMGPGKKATGIGADTKSWGYKREHPLERLGDPSEVVGMVGSLGRVGKVISKGPHPAISALLELLRGKPQMMGPEEKFLGERIGGLVPQRRPIVTPKGFDFRGTAMVPARDPELVKQIAVEKPFSRLKPAGSKRDAAPAGFESKFTPTYEDLTALRRYRPPAR